VPLSTAAHPVGPFTVEAVPLTHTIPSAGFLVHAGDAAYLHLGDTGPTEAVWTRARALHRRGALRAVAVEVSFPSTQEKLAHDTGHLTPHSLLVELSKLAGIAPLPTVEKMTAAEAAALAARLAPAFAECPVLTIHIKAAHYDTVVRELDALHAAGLNLIRPLEGERYRF
jgi:hypothetical protein